MSLSFFVEIILLPKMESLFRGVHVNLFKIGIDVTHGCGGGSSSSNEV